MHKWLYIFDNGEGYSDWGINICTSDIPPAVVEVLVQEPAKICNWNWDNPRTVCAINIIFATPLSADQGFVVYNDYQRKSLAQCLLSEIDMSVLVTKYAHLDEVRAYLQDPETIVQARKLLHDMERWAQEARVDAEEAAEEAKRRQDAVDFWIGVAEGLPKAPPVMSDDEIRAGKTAPQHLVRWADDQAQRAKAKAAVEQRLADRKLAVELIASGTLTPAEAQRALQPKIDLDDA